MSKKLWQITGTNEFSDNKEVLKKVRAQMNADAGFDEKDKELNTNKWKFKITKGPDHPNFSSRF